MNLITGQTFNLTESDHKHPLEIAALLVQEDLVIMQRPPNEEKYYANVITAYISFVIYKINSSIGISSLFSIWMVT